MADQPSSIAREAKSIHQSVKELLKSREPFEKELDFQRKNLRRRYLSLLLVHPYADESKDAETRLWMETSHAFISSYKQRISHLERAIQKQQQQQGANQQNPNSRGHGPVEQRKLIQRFRQFLAEEEKFWNQFVVRFARSFDLGEAQSTLVALGIVKEDFSIAEAAKGTEGSEEATGTQNLPHNGGRNHFQFPSIPEGGEPLIPRNNEERESRMEILGKALTCLGDIARYREQYNEAGGRPRAGYEDHSGMGRRGRAKKGGNTLDIPRPRNYEKARHCYQQAKLLVPHEGNPSHQLAILASYEKDMFTSLAHYYRALCVRHPYDSASDNIHTILHKATEQWRTKGNASPESTKVMPKLRVDAFKDKMVLLHGLYRAGLEKHDTLTINLAEEVFTEFYSLVSERHLPEDFILQVIVLSQAALWKHRMIRDSPKHSKRPDITTSSSSLPSAVIEARLFTHVLSLHRALLEVGIEQLKEPVVIGPDGDLAQRIMVEFRRTLPALRIASKWLLANFKLVMQDPESLDSKGEKGNNHSSKTPGAQISPSSLQTIEFWQKYAEFLRVLSKAFPSVKLPDLTFVLAEDVEMKGFLPLRGILEGGKETNVDENVPTEEKEVHPNVVQLMRIKDLTTDAKKIIDMEHSPLALYGNQFMLKGVESQAQPVPISEPLSLSDLEDDSDAILNVVNAGRNPSNGTVKTLDGKNASSQSDDEDEIVWNPRASPVSSPKTGTATVNQTSITHSVPLAVPGLSSPVQVPVAPPVAGQISSSPLRATPRQSPTKLSGGSPSIALTTAEDLLNGFMSSKISPRIRMQSRTVSDPLTPTLPLLTGNNIWSTSEDEQASMRIAASNNSHQYSSPISPPREMQNRVHDQPVHWPPSSNVVGASQSNLLQHQYQRLPSGVSPVFSPLHPTGLHHRVPSSSAVAAQLFPDPIRNPGIPEYGYGTPIPALEERVMHHQLSTPGAIHAPYGNTNQSGFSGFGPSSESIYQSSLPNPQAFSGSIGMDRPAHHNTLDREISTQSFASPSMPLWGAG